MELHCLAEKNKSAMLQQKGYQRRSDITILYILLFDFRVLDEILMEATVSTSSSFLLVYVFILGCNRGLYAP